MTIQVGDTLPSVELDEGNPGNKVNPAEAFARGRHILFAVPGAFTPGCSRTHLPGYVNDAEKIRGKGIDSVACVAVNDAFVMDAWGKAQGAEGKVRMLADPRAEFTRALGLEVEAKGLGGTRSKRYAMVIENGKVSRLNIEPDGFGLSCSLSNAIIDEL